MARESTYPAHSTIHLRTQAPVAERVLLPGDPGRAFRLAQALLEQPKMLNLNRGLWGYTGAAADGGPMTIQSTGMGGPSAAIVVEELIELGARRLVRVGTCGALDGEVALGSLIAVERVLARDGASRALGAGDEVLPDDALLDRLRAHADAAGAVVTTDLFYDPRKELEDDWRAAGALAVEMEAATVLTVAALRGAAAACLLLVSNVVGGQWLDTDDLHAAEVELGRAAAAVLS
jgi:uridine phosphorylase